MNIIDNKINSLSIFINLIEKNDYDKKMIYFIENKNTLFNIKYFKI